MGHYQESHPRYRELQIDEHLRFIEPDLAHARESLSWVQSADVIQYMGADFLNPSLEGEIDRLRQIIASGDEYSWMIELDGTIIGNVCINSIAETTRKNSAQSGNLTVLIGKKVHWGKGIGLNVCRTVLDWAFEGGGFGAMVSRALQENIASIKTLQKLGFSETGTEPYEGSPHSPPSLWKNFRIDRDVWQSRRV